MRSDAGAEAHTARRHNQGVALAGVASGSSFVAGSEEKKKKILER
jgi:hypothetical protein